ncbi:hypothetical protein EK21DRAFT_41262, partial [Setomelanomma holmii]
RLISIFPESCADIRCELKNAYLDDDTTPDYRALSYEWGPPKPLKRIIVNDRFLHVRLNLYNCLKTFRARLDGAFDDESQWLWVDQICMDKTVIKERNHQVKMMSDVYRQTTSVYVWLG